MAGYWNDAKVFVVETQGLPVSLDYKTIMTAAEKYIPYTEESAATVPEANKLLNTYIEGISSFDVIVYGTKWTNGIPETFDTNLYNMMTVESYEMIKDIMPLKSVGIYGTSSFSVGLDVQIAVRERFGSSLDNFTEEQLEEVEKFIEENTPKAGDYVVVYGAVSWLAPTITTDEDGEIHIGPAPEGQEKEFIPVIIKILLVDPEEDDPDNQEILDPNDVIPITFDPDNIEDDVSIIPVVVGEDGNPLPVTYLKYIFLNTISLYDVLYKLGGIIHSKTWFLQAYVSPLCPVPYTFTVTQLGVRNGKNSTFTFHYKPQTVNITGSSLERITKMNNPDVSYSLVRTNPKLTGNVKVVVDSSSNIYLDTFKISDTLSRRRYRHIKVGSNTYYGNSLMTHFRGVPTTEFYKVQDMCYNMFTPAQTYKEQFYDVYRYGAFTNDDDMYTENFAILAPLCVKRIFPDFFLIFKVDKNSAEYDEVNMSDDEKIKYFIKKGKLVKSYDMREGSDLGTYIRNVYEMSKDTTGYIYEAYDSTNYNKFTGISLERGVVSSIYESVCDQEKVNNQVYLNEFLTKGFERNHIVSKDIINFQFMFDDPDASLFSINTYFGLYVKVNTEDSDFSCISKTEDNRYGFDASVHTFQTIRLSESSDYNTLIYGITTPDEFIRIDESINTSRVNDRFLKKPYKNIFTSPVTKISTDDASSYVTVQFNNMMDVGDHLRVICPTDDMIFEIIMYGDDIDDDSTSRISGTYPDEYGVTEVITNRYNKYGHKYTFKRIGVHVNRRDYIAADDLSAEIKKQVDQIYRALSKFDKKYLMPWMKSDKGLSIKGFREDMIFERICSASGFTETQRDYLEKTDDEDKTLMFFGSVYPKKLLLNVDQKYWESTKLAYMYPLHFESVGNRMAHAVKFINTKEIGDGDNIYACDTPPTILSNTTTVLYYGQNNTKDGNKNISIKEPIKVTTYRISSNTIKENEEELVYAQAYTAPDKVFLNISNPLITGKTLSMFSAYPINAGVCSILQMKDFDFNVLDSTTTLLTTSSQARGVIKCNQEYNTMSIFNSVPRIQKDDIPGNDKSDNTFETFYGDEAKFRSWVSTQFYKLENEEPQSLYKLEQLCSKEYVLKPKLTSPRKHIETEIIDTDSSDCFCIMSYEGSIDFDSYSTYSWKKKEATEESRNTIDNTAGTIIFETDFPKTPIRVEDEEDFRNYIDMYTQYDSSTKWTGEFSDMFANKNEFLKTMFEDNHNKMDISLTSPYCCKWKSIGSDARGETMKIMYDYDGLTSLDMPSYYVPNDTAYNTYLGYMYLANKNTLGCSKWKKYIPKTFDDIIEIEDIEGNSDSYVDDYGMSGRKYLKTYILKNKGSLDDILYDGKDSSNKFSPAYISGENTLEFISAGIKIRIRSNNSNILNLSKYSGYSSIFITLPVRSMDYSKMTELIIDETKKELMFVWYKPANTFRLGYKTASTTIDENYLKADSSAGYRLVLPMTQGIKNIISYTFDDIDNVAYRSAYIDDIGDYATRDEKYNKLADNIDPSTHIGKRLCESMAYIYVPYINIDDSCYSKYKTMAFCGVIFDTDPVTKRINYTFPYYDNGGLVPVLATTWYNTKNEWLANADIENYVPYIGEHYEAYVLTDSLDFVDPLVASYADLKNDVGSYAVFVKTDQGTKDYTNITGLLTIDIVDPIELETAKGKTYYVHPSYGEPVMKDIFNFNYNTYSMTSGSLSEITSYFAGEEASAAKTGLEGVFKKSFDGANVSIRGINTIDQMWFNKYTTDNNYCQQKINGKDCYNLSMDSIYNVSLMEDSWQHDTYRQYYMDGTEEKYSIRKGYTTGYELRTFFNSKGVCLKNPDGSQEFTITSWKSTEIANDRKYIKLNITDSIVYAILTNPAFVNSWSRLSLASNDHKIKYIKNTILNFININNKTKFILRKIDATDNDDSIVSNRINFITDFKEEGTVEINNYKNELRYEKGMYYMYVYPEEGTTYYAKMIITL